MQPVFFVQSFITAFTLSTAFSHHQGEVVKPSEGRWKGCPRLQELSLQKSSHGKNNVNVSSYLKVGLAVLPLLVCIVPENAVGGVHHGNQQVDQEDDRQALVHGKEAQTHEVRKFK